jgi:hypothetical protein
MGINAYNTPRTTANLAENGTMVETSEVITLILGVISLLFVCLNIQQIGKVPFFSLFFLSYIIMIMSWTATVLEGFIWSVFFNFLEHTEHLLSSVLLASWCWKIALRNKN